MPPDSSKRSRIASRLAERPFLVFTVYLVIGASALLGLAWLHSTEIKETTSLKAAEAYSDAVSAMRGFYSEHVVPRAQNAGTKVSHDFRSSPDTIPFPATLTIELANELKKKNKSGGFQFNFYSADPFPWRRGRTLDRFEQDALEAVNASNGQKFVRFEEYRGRKAVRVAAPVVMGKTCVECHNSHPESPRKDWKVGDIRGIQQITLPIPSVGATILPDIRKSGIFIGVFSLLGLALIWLLLRELQRRIAETTRLALATEQQNIELAAAKSAADHANRAQGEMIANVGHELRTPLNSIIGFSEIIQDERVGDLGNPEYRTFAQEINKGGHQLLEIINSILMMSQLESGSFELHQEPLSLDLLIDETIQSWHDRSAAQDIRIGKSVPRALPPVMFDRRSMKRLLSNLTENAIKFSKPGGHVEILANVSPGGDVTIAISDNGIGIAADKVADIIKPFRQAQGERNRKFEGVGLGLSMAHSIARLHDSQLEVASVEGSGTTVTITIPTSRVMSGEIDAVSREIRTAA